MSSCWFYSVFYITLLLVTVTHSTLLSDHISRYEALQYSTHTLKTHHDRMKRSDINTLGSVDKTVRLYFTALNRTFSLILWPSQDVFAPGAQFLVHTKEGSVVPSKYDHLSFYRGMLEGQPHSRVHGHIQNGIFDGEIITDNQEHYHIEYAYKYSTHNILPQGTHSIIYSSDDLIHKTPGHTAGCALKDAILRKMETLQASAQPIAKPRVPLSDEEYSYKLTDSLRRKRDISKRADTVSGGQFCQIFVAVDHLFFQHIAGSSEENAITEVTSVFSSSQSIFQSTDFNSDGRFDAITPQLVRTEVLTTDSYNRRFASNNIGVNDFLDLWSQIDHTEFCLALLLTYRDFANGVLGLAWVAQPPGGSRGGICEGRVRLSVGERSLNTAIVSYLNYGSRQPRGVVSVTVAHEFGHNFGSSHDPDSGQCSPGGSAGNYIMYPRATDGTQTNNDKFSPCSISAIYSVLQTKSNCFTTSGAFCGNRIREGDEQCDCGAGDQAACDEVDRCCQAGMCMLKTGSQCSLSDSCCINCQLADATHKCSNDTECAERAFCTGTSPTCPTPVYRNISCMNATRFCVRGECTGSVCLTIGLAECQCTASDQLCDVCCMHNNNCTSTFTLSRNRVLPVAGQYRDSGRSCNSFTGYCSDSNPPMCVGVNNEETLNELLDIFTLETLNSVIAWLRTYWWIPIIVIVVIIILIVLLHLTYRKRKPIKKAARRASVSVRRGGSNETPNQSNGRSGAAGGGGANRRGGISTGSNQTRTDMREALQRLKKFFPNCDTDVILQIYRTEQTEPKTVKKLLSLGFRMKKVPMPRL